ncbi:MAG: UvrD-helicase domain-containing protein [Gammaproteobacteria bacterium]
MASYVPPVDDEARSKALDVSRSFIVQAPAGSGKTELLTQRFLSLLALVDSPEEVWAVTFTRKAAAEMRRRIFDALENAMGEEPEEEHKLRTWNIAKSVIRRDEKLRWELIVNPNRLRIYTIDSLCANLVRQMPVLSGFGTIPTIANFPQRLYGLAARRTLRSLHEEDEQGRSVQLLLTHLDNNAERAEQLLSAMMANRDRWLPHVAGQGRPELQREALEQALLQIVTEHLERLSAELPIELLDELLDLAVFASNNISDESSPVFGLRSIDALPDSSPENLPIWAGIARFLLTDAGTIRRRVVVSDGFPPSSKAKSQEEKDVFKTMKARMMTLLEQLDDCPAFVSELAGIRELPPVAYTHDQWGVFAALLNLLNLSVAHLKVLFQETGEVDYTEISHRALTALGSSENPTDLALQLDYRLKHLLVDEFQDTARSQFDLVEGLVAGWQPGDGRTLFLVGDPMQSIYRFREANVGLFLQARDYGLADIRPEFLQLECNFRSDPSLVGWCNKAFTTAFPTNDNIDRGAVKFSPATAAVVGDRHEQSVELHAVPAPSAHVEADLVAQLIKTEVTAKPDASIAVLVRARTHLNEILPAMRRARIRYRALDLEALREQPIVRDLFALTRALLHLGDRTAWLTVLRAPWCGLLLGDLHALAADNHDLTIWELCINERRRKPLSDDGQMRLSRIKGVLAKSLSERGRRSLRRWVEGTWAALGGPACVFNDSEGRNAEAFFRLLEQADTDGFHDDLDYLNDLIDQLKAADDTGADSGVQVMTIHKAKGLEFDTVILPAMERMTNNVDSSLLRWIETTKESGETSILLAPIQPTGEREPIYRYLNKVDKHMSLLEDVRLLYVAATRARSKLHLIGGIKTKEDGSVTSPGSGSFMSFVWPTVKNGLSDPRFLVEEDTVETMARPAIDPLNRPLYRVPSSWMLPSKPHPKPWKPRSSLDAEVEAVEFSWATETARHIGTVVHRVLQQIATEGLSQWSAQWSDTLTDYLRQMMRLGSVPQSEVAESAMRCEQAIRNTIDDERGRWILDGHKEAANELELSGWLDDQAHRVVLDRTFIADGYRWIIDYKTGAHEGGTVDAFMDTELERYQPQLERYARIMMRLHHEPIKLALYFPMLKGWREWEYRK